ncbi:MAG: flagellar motor switch protein FliN [Sneathiella sp.]
MADNEDLELDELTADGGASSAADQGEAADGAEGSGEEGTDASSVDAPNEDSEISRTAADLEAVFDIPVHVSAVLGKSRMQVSQLLKLGRGAVVELDRKVGEAIDIYVNNRLVARGEVVVVEDRLGVTMTEIIKSDRR